VGALIMIHLTQASEEALFVLSSPPFHSPKYVKSCAPVIVRASREDDVDAMLDIYRRHIARGVEPAFAHDPEALQPEDIKRRRRNMRKHRLPHLVADRAGLVMGYTYAVPFRKRPAYRYTIKHSIYVHPDYLHAGIGRILLPALIDACAAAGYRQMIGYIDASNTPSIGLHTACGFRQVGCLPLVACKFGQWTTWSWCSARSVAAARRRRMSGQRCRPMTIDRLHQTNHGAGAVNSADAGKLQQALRILVRLNAALPFDPSTPSH
jgi:L-amino acid N-acyltransferase YncA